MRTTLAIIAVGIIVGMCAIDACAAPPININALLKELPAQGGTVAIPPGVWFVDEPIDMRGRTHVRIFGYGAVLNTPDEWPRNAPIVDMTGATYCVLEGVTLRGRNTTGEPATTCGVLLARDATGGSAGGHAMTNVHIAGVFSVASCVALGSECNTYTGCWFTNSAPDGQAFHTSYGPPPGWQDPPGGESRGGSNLVHSFRGCVFGVYDKAETSQSTCVYLGYMTQRATFDTCCFSNRERGSSALSGVVAYSFVRAVFLNCDFETESSISTIRTTGYYARIRLDACDVRARQRVWIDSLRRGANVVDLRDCDEPVINAGW
jgi:hypothetical protein